MRVARRIRPSVVGQAATIARRRLHAASATAANHSTETEAPVRQTPPFVVVFDERDATYSPPAGRPIGYDAPEPVALVARTRGR